MTRSIPEWFTVGEATTGQVMQRIAASICDLPMSEQVRSAPMLAHWFLLDTLLLANRANRDGMHANALALTRQCVESMSVIELGICGHPQAESILTAWDADRLPWQTPRMARKQRVATLRKRTMDGAVGRI